MAVRVGDTGVAESSLHPQGVIRLDGRRYPARAEFGTVAPTVPVVVVSGDHLGLVVRPTEPDTQPAALPGFGQPVHVSFLDRLAEEERDEARAKAAESDRRWRGAVISAAAGIVAALAVLWWVWDHVRPADDPVWQPTGIALLGGAAWGAAVFLLLSDALGRFDRGGGCITTISTGLALVGGTAGAAVGIPAFGMVGGLSLAVVGTLTFGLAFPLLLVLGDDLGPAT
ncbi:MAG TPA: hypothetical protein VKD90_09830 [Gemmataceae bacterium]|nr:hypothetical protein [Gemmataceae bacterium]